MGDLLKYVLLVVLASALLVGGGCAAYYYSNRGQTSTGLGDQRYD